MKKGIVISAIIILIVIAGILFLNSGSWIDLKINFSSYAVKTPDNTAYSNSKTCSDSDGGIFYSVAGEVNYNTTSTLTGKPIYKKYSDKCVSSKTLAEYFCIGNFVRRSSTDCKLGCKENACVK